MGGNDLNQIRENKWMIGCIAMAIVLLIVSVNSFTLHKKMDELKKEYVGYLNHEWYELYRMSETVEKHYITNDYQEPTRYRLFVNQVAHNFTGRPDDLSINMRNLLTLAYDPLFLDLSLEEGTLNKEEASTLLKDMNDDIMLISRSIIDMPDDEKENLLLDPTSSEFNKVSTEVKAAYHKYIKLVDNYFRNNKY